MYTWFQNLKKEDNEKKLFHFRGAIGRVYNRLWFSYEAISGRALHFTFANQPEGLYLIITPFCLFTIFLTLRGWKLPFFPYNKTYGVVSHGNYEYWFKFGMRAWTTENYWVFRPLDILFGKPVSFSKNKMKNYGPRLFMFRGVEYQMDDILVDETFVFRRRIPFGLFHRSYLGMQLKIKNPPGHAGKGENSWDCDDDAILGLSCPYVNGPELTYKNREKVFEYCIKKYVKSCKGNISKYGRAENDNVDPKTFDFKYIGKKPKNNEIKNEQTTHIMGNENIKNG